MFFTRLAVAALSFGSIAQVFAAPIGTNLEGISIEVSVPAADGSIVRRNDLTFLATVTQVTNEIEPLKAEITTLAADPAGAVTPELVSAMGKVATALSFVPAKLDSLKAAGVDKDAVLMTVDGLTNTTPDVIASKTAALFQQVDDICHSIAGLKSMSLVKPQLESIKSEVTHTQAGVQALPNNGATGLLLGLLGIVVGDINGLVSL